MVRLSGVRRGQRIRWMRQMRREVGSTVSSQRQRNCIALEERGLASTDCCFPLITSQVADITMLSCGERTRHLIHGNPPQHPHEIYLVMVYLVICTTVFKHGQGTATVEHNEMLFFVGFLFVCLFVKIMFSLWRDLTGQYGGLYV